MTAKISPELLAVMDEILAAEWGQPYLDHIAAVRKIHAGRAAEVAELLGMPVEQIDAFFIGFASGIFDRPDLVADTPRFVPGDHVT